MKAYFNTFGCKTNQYDTALIGQSLAAGGIELTGDLSAADWVVVNTCSVTRRGEDKACQWVRRVGRENPGAKIAVVGCSVEVSAGRFRALPNVRLLLGTEEKFRLCEMIFELDGDKGSDNGGPREEKGAVAETRRYAESVIDPSRQERARAFVKIQDGCNNRCTYCIVPLARGTERSREERDILREAVALEQAGHREIVLTGIHIGRYGHDLGRSRGLSSLVETLLRGTSRIRLRLSSVEIGEMDSGLLDLVSGEPRVCRHLHVPLQHGSDRVLAAMGRWYGTKEFRATVEELVARTPQLGLGSDLIVGFPGENGEEFSRCVEFVRSLPFTYLHVFPYSPRPGTPAASMSGLADKATVRERVKELRALSTEKSVAFRRSLDGAVLPVLPETELDGGITACRADNYVRAYCRTPSPESESLIRVEGLWRDGVRGTVIENE